MSEPMIGQRWCSVDGKSWSRVVGEITAYVWLLEDETTYRSLTWQTDFNSDFHGHFDCLKKAKAACIEAIEDAQDLADAEVVMADGDETIPWDEMKLKQWISELEAELARRPVVLCARSNISGNFFWFYDEPMLFASHKQASNCPGLPQDWIIEPYTGEEE